MIPKTLPEPPPEWRGPYEEMARENGLGSSFDEACKIISKFYDEMIKVVGLRR